MSRPPALNYTQVVCQCPHGHLLGTIVATKRSVGWYPRPLGDNRPTVEGTLLPVGKKVRADCPSCRKDENLKRYANDYQASWANVAAKIAQAQEAHAERVTLIFG